MRCNQAAKAAGVSKNSVVKWYSACRQVGSLAEFMLHKILGTHNEPIQIDESYFAGRRKYSCGRLCKSDKNCPGEQEARQRIEIELAAWSRSTRVKMKVMNSRLDRPIEPTRGKDLLALGRCVFISLGLKYDFLSCLTGQATLCAS